ncbi:MAG: hypothetical protein KAV41_02725 [Candidatus Pacebacteria bacterium]|nr:hypothetical protein [Candidatus Paceibacterota bacterium]
MKNLFCLILVVGISFFVGCASAPIPHQTGDALIRGNGKGRPAVIIVDNQTKKDIRLIIDGEWKWDVSAGKIKNFKVKNIKEKMIFTIKFPEGKSFQKKLFIRPGRKYPIVVHPPGVRVRRSRRGSSPEPYINVGWEMYKSISNRALREMRERMNK